METKKGNTYPQLEGDIRYRMHRKMINGLKQKLMEKEKALGAVMTEIQQKCPHENGWQHAYAEMRGWPFNEEKKLIRKTCSDCGYEMHKPQGTAFEVCTLCWGEMENKTDSLQCKVCSNTYKKSDW